MGRKDQIWLFQKIETVAGDAITFLKPLGNALGRFQSDDCTIGESYEIWKKISQETPEFLEKRTSRERPKSAPYLRLKKTRKPLFLQLETTKALKKLKIEKKISEFFLNFFSKFPVSRIVPKNVKGGTLFISC